MDKNRHINGNIGVITHLLTIVTNFHGHSSSPLLMKARH